MNNLKKSFKNKPSISGVSPTLFFASIFAFLFNKLFTSWMSPLEEAVKEKKFQLKN